MSVIRSVSASELTQLKGEDMTQDIGKINDEEEHGDACNDPVFTSKTQTLDRFARPSTMSQHGEKRKKSFFASFRLSKKPIGKKKDEQSGSGSDLSRTQEKLDENISSTQQLALKDDQEQNNNNEAINNDSLNKPRKRYLNRMSSFVIRVASKVQSGTDSTSVLRSKLERSQTVTGSDLVPIKVDYIQFENQVPGLMGIRNHGNTCFINAVIQCLSHTDVLAEYFVLDHYKNDLARCNRINSKKFGTRGEITDHLATLLKSLWVLRYVPDISLNLKNVVEKYEPCYRGSNQHDAAEFLMFILDKVHEDLNTASKRKYKKIKNSYGRPDEIVAAETLANHLRCNSSFVQDIFQAQFRSSLKCPHCLRESNTFDPYLCVSIPIPQHEVLAIFVTIVYLNQQPKQVKIGVSIEASASVKQLRYILAADCGISEENLILTEIDGEGFHRTFADNASVNIIKSTDPIYGVELTYSDSSSALQENEAFVHVVWVNVLLADPDDIRFGGVYQSQVARDITYQDLQKLLLKEMSTIVTLETLISEQDKGIFLICLDSGAEELSVLEPDLDLPLLHQSVDEALSICHPLAGPPHIKLVLQWSQDSKDKYITDDVDHVDEHSSVEDLKKKPPECASVTLGDCLQLHTSAEMLSCGDAWHCPTCNRKQQVLKRLTLWSAPQVLVIHLKRFRQASLSSNSSKLNTIVNFPLSGFDISDHMAGRITSTGSPVNGGPEGTGASKIGGVWSPWKRNKKQNMIDGDHIYDLYAVCNHHGRDLQGGHYTAFCRNTTNGKWYSFDDFSIEEVSQETVVDQDAYILFYQRRDEVSSPCFTDATEKTHWAHKIPITSLPPILKVIPNEVPSSEGVQAEEKKPSLAESPGESNSEAEPSKEIIKEEKTSNVDRSKDGWVTQLNTDAINSKVYVATDVVRMEVFSESRKDCNAVAEINVVSSESLALKSSHSSLSEDKSLRKHNSTTSIRKSNERIPSFMMETVDTRDIGSIQAIVESERCSQGSLDKAGSETSPPDSQEVIPEVRIQPASLEVLASHRYKMCPNQQQSVIKVTLRPKGHDASSSRPSSISSCSSRGSDTFTSLVSTELPTTPISLEVNKRYLTNGYVSETGCSSSSSDETPDIRITSGKIPPKRRQSNTNKIPSFVVIRTPTASPRAVRGGKMPVGFGNTRPIPGNCCRSRIRETYPSATRSDSFAARERTNSYCCGIKTGQMNGYVDDIDNKELQNGEKNTFGYARKHEQKSQVYCHRSLVNGQKSCSYSARISDQNSYINGHDNDSQLNHMSGRTSQPQSKQINGHDNLLHRNKINSRESKPQNIVTRLKKCSDPYELSKSLVKNYDSSDRYNQYVTESSV